MAKGIAKSPEQPRRAEAVVAALRPRTLDVGDSRGATASLLGGRFRAEHRSRLCVGVHRAEGWSPATSVTGCRFSQSVAVILRSLLPATRASPYRPLRKEWSAPGFEDT